LETLTSIPDSLLGQLFCEGVDALPDSYKCTGPDGSERIFIDRDGRHFNHILNYHRCPDTWFLVVKDKIEYEEIVKDVNYFKVYEMEHKLKLESSTYTPPEPTPIPTPTPTPQPQYSSDDLGFNFFDDFQSNRFYLNNFYYKH